MVRSASEHLKAPNRLIHEKSPYLLQHAFNPVDWYPWGEEAFAKARSEDKPIFLSIGYSTCYWCHVMEREVFENEELAALMNAHVVSIKVDREERPDIDRIYMAALTAMSGSGGWPLSMFLTPDLKPFFGATYIPPAPRYGRAGFGEVLTRIHEVWVNDRNRVLDAGANLFEYLNQLPKPDDAPVPFSSSVLDRAFEEFSESFDPVHGGFSHAPKFPRPAVFTFLHRYFKRTGNRKSLTMSLETLRSMALGGLYDHVGGGFHRYATDGAWHVPHFEKMLYDQAQLVIAYLEAFQITQEAFYANVAVDVLEYVLREMSHAEGGWYSAQDAESGLAGDREGKKKEGAYYTWRWEELQGMLNEEEMKIAGLIFDIREQGNVREDPHGEFAGLNILHVVRSDDEAAREAGVPADRIRTLRRSIRSKLLAARSSRPSPHLDDKILVSWNGLMMSAFARASRVLGNPTYAKAAERSARFILETLHSNAGLLRRFRDGESRFDAHLEDYACLVQGLVDLYEATFDARWISEAINLTREQIERMYDEEHGGFFDTAGTDPTILVRTKEFYDSAEPSGNSVAILNLYRLAAVTGEREYEERARASLQYFAGRVQRMPAAVPHILAAYDFGSVKPMQIILAGEPEEKELKALLTEIDKRFLPNKVLLVATNASRPLLEPRVPFLKTVQRIGGKATAYVCEDFACRLPTSDPQFLARLLDDGGLK